MDQDKDKDIKLSYHELLAISQSEPEWLAHVIEDEIIIIEGEPQQALFSGYQLAQVRRAQRISQDFEASIPATALILQLLDELEELRKISR